MSKQVLLKELTDLVYGNTAHGEIFYFDNTFKSAEDGNLTEITPQQAAAYLSSGSRLIYIMRDYRKWDETLNTFIGEEPQHPPLPDVPEGTNILNVTCCFSPKDMAEVFTGKLLGKGSD